MAATLVDPPSLWLGATHLLLGPRVPRLTDRLLRRAVLAAVVVGVLLGAMACAAGIASGNGHAGHQTVVASSGPVAEPVGLHPEIHSDDAATGRALGSSAAPMNAGSDGSPASTAQGHPGMACVVAVDLIVPPPKSSAATDAFSDIEPTPLTDCIADLDPPVPRVS